MYTHLHICIYKPSFSMRSTPLSSAGTFTLPPFPTTPLPLPYSSSAPVPSSGEWKCVVICTGRDSRRRISHWSNSHAHVPAASSSWVVTMWRLVRTAETLRFEQFEYMHVCVCVCVHMRVCVCVYVD